MLSPGHCTDGNPGPGLKAAYVTSDRMQSWCYCRVAVATRLLEGLRCFHITAAGTSAWNAAPTDSKNTIVPRQTKQQEAKAKKRDADLGEAVAVTTARLSVSQIESTAFYPYLDLTVGLEEPSTYHLARRWCSQSRHASQSLPALGAAVLRMSSKKLLLCTVFAAVPSSNKWVQHSCSVWQS